MPVVELFVRNGQQLEPLPPVCVYSGATNVVYHGVPVVFPGGSLSFHLPLSPGFRDRGPLTDATAGPGGLYSFRIPDASDAFANALYQLRSRTAPAHPTPAPMPPVAVYPGVPQPMAAQPMPAAYPAPLPGSPPLPPAPLPQGYAVPPGYPPGYAPPPPGYPSPPGYPAPAGAYPPPNGYPQTPAPQMSPADESESLEEEDTGSRKRRARESGGIPTWVFAVVGGVLVLGGVAVAVVMFAGKGSTTKPTEPAHVPVKPKEKEKEKKPPKGDPNPKEKEKDK